jgi:hypothetical protein
MPPRWDLVEHDTEEESSSEEEEDEGRVSEEDLEVDNLPTAQHEPRKDPPKVKAPKISIALNANGSKAGCKVSPVGGRAPIICWGGPHPNRAV